MRSLKHHHDSLIYIPWAFCLTDNCYLTQTCGKPLSRYYLCLKEWLNMDFLWKVNTLLKTRALQNTCVDSVKESWDQQNIKCN